MLAPPLPRLHVVTDDEVLGRPGFTELARSVLSVGGERLALHLRGPGASAARLHGLSRALRIAAREVGALLFVNDRVDLVRVAGLDGVHLGRRSLPPEVARQLLPEGRWVGVSVHGDVAARAAARGADYLVVGTVFATRSHPGRAGAGPELVRLVCTVTSLPVFAIGGVTEERVAELLVAGAQGVVVSSGIWGAADPRAAVLDYLSQLPPGAAATSPHMETKG